MGTLWKNKDFMKLWAGQTISEIGSRITREGIPLTAVLVLSASPLEMSVLRLASFLPVALLGLFVGVWVDRLSRRRLMIFSDSVRGLLLLCIPVAAWIHYLHVWILIVVAAITGLFTLMFDTSYQAYVPWLVRREKLEEANTKLSVTSSAAEIVGPGLTGALVQALTAPIAIVYDALSYFVSAASLLFVRGHSPEKSLRRHRHGSLAAEDGEALRNWKSQVKDGFDVLRTNQVLRASAGTVITLGFASSMIYVLYTLYAIQNLGMPPWLFGLTVTVGGIGSLIGAALSGRLVRRFGFGRVIIGMLFLYGASTFFIPFASGPLWRATAFLMAAQLFGDTTGMIYEILDMTLRQTVTSDEILGRVNATIRVFEVSLTALGSVVAGVLGQFVGIRVTMGVASCFMLFATLWLVLSPIRQMKELPADEFA